jgi:hypothetical protein
MEMAMRRVLALAIPLPIAIALSGCGSGSGGGAPDGSAPASGQGTPAPEFDVLDAAVGMCTGPQLSGEPSGACTQQGLHCIASDTSCCDCLTADLSSCGVPLEWACGDHLQTPCPPGPPVESSPCDAGQLANSGCTYCLPPGGSYVCQNGGWQRVLDTLYCQK